MATKPSKEKIEEIMWEQDSDFFKHPLLAILSTLYGALVSIRLLLFKLGLLRTKRLLPTVISVGNITTGGSGKTPIVVALSQMLTGKKYSVVILSRGYKRKGRTTAIVSDKNSVLLDVKEAGDEPYLLALRCKGVPVIVGPDRFHSGSLAIEKFSPDVIILDDGFSHKKLHRDLDLLLFDGERWMGSGYLLPRGPLREPRSSVNRADIIMVKGASSLSKKQKFKQQSFSFYYAPKNLTSLADKSTVGINTLKGKKVLALSALASPESFYLTLKACGVKTIEKLPFPDHHWFSASDIKMIKEQGKDADFIVTTEKDLVRLDPVDFSGFKLYALAIDAKISNSRSLLKAVESKISNKCK